MVTTTVQISDGLLRHARNLTGARTDREVVESALRRLIAHKSKQEMVKAIGRLTDLPSSLHAPTVDPGQPDNRGGAQR